MAKNEQLVASCPTELPAETSAILRIFGKNTLWLWLDLGALRLGTMLAGLFLIRYFGPANFGIYSTALAVGWLLNAIIDLGLTRYSARAVAATPREASPILALSLFTTVVSAVPTIGLLIVALNTGHMQLACLTAGFVLCNLEGTSSQCSSILTADLRSRAILAGSILGAAGLIGLTIVTIWLKLTVLELLIGLCFKSLLVLCVRLWQLRSHWPTASDWTWSSFLRVARDAWPFFANSLTQVGYGKVAILCLGFASTQVAVGWFAAAYTISDVIPQWSYALSGALLPLWTRLFETGRAEEMLSLRRRLLDGILLATIPVWITLAVFAPQVCSLLGPQYIRGAPALRIVAARCVLSVLDGFLGHGFLVAVNRVSERQKALARCVILLAVLSLVLGAKWGAVGVGFALVISDVSLILQYLWIASRIGFEVQWPSMTPSLAAAGLMLACAVAVPADINFVLRALTALTVYFCVLLVLSRERLSRFGQTLWECIAP